MPQFIYKDTSIFYQLEGKGEIVLLIHGFLENLSMWDAISAKLSKDFNVLRVDLPGFGKSAYNAAAGKMSFYSDCIDSLLVNLGVDRVRIIGHSMGGYIALDFAQTYSHKVLQLCLYHSTARPDSADKKKDRDRAIRALLNKPETYLKTAIPFLFPSELAASCTSAIQQMIYEAEQYNPQAIVLALEAMKARASQIQMFKKLDCKKVYIAGKLDPLLNCNSLKNEAKDCGAQFVLLENAGHMSHWEAPDMALEAIYSCLKK